MRFVLPGDIDDVTAPSGGNVYDRRLCQGLGPVHEIAVQGSWPHPDASARTELARSLAELPDGGLVLLDGLVACGVPEIVVPQANRLRLVVLVHLPLAVEGGEELDAPERETLRAAKAVVATSAWAARWLIDHHGLDASQVHVVTPGVDPAPLAPGTDGVSQLLCVASVTPRKGQDLLVEALASVAYESWNCLCVGPLERDPAYVERLQQLIKQHELGDRVRLAGPQTGEELASSYRAADLLVLPSRAETYGMVVTEALARGIPVLATNVDGIPDTLGQDPDGGVPGILVAPDALTDGLQRWFGEPDLRHHVRISAGQRRGMLASWDETARRMAVVLEQL